MPVRGPAFLLWGVRTVVHPHVSKVNASLQRGWFLGKLLLQKHLSGAPNLMASGTREYPPSHPELLHASIVRGLTGKRERANTKS
jgi:hypothetical protein